LGNFFSLKIFEKYKSRSNSATTIKNQLQFITSHWGLMKNVFIPNRACYVALFFQIVFAEAQTLLFDCVFIV